MNKVAISDMFEIQSSQLALAKQADADTKPFAEKMVQDHQKASNMCAFSHRLALISPPEASSRASTRSITTRARSLGGRPFR